ncbi:thiamine phosphate synthase [Moritella sp. 24]|uniref:thiamine phosphate synthase n=1 Tax=Moritella sp. 24 TaxID=2746230 RepID=UPI001BABF8B4|nr:thiamine phosphate synthase [Moritella sp. 24]QUM74994.1 thiamine phosphate synthase [Moritella sp. 24]
MTQAIIWTITGTIARDNATTQVDINTINALDGRGYHVSTAQLSDGEFAAELAILHAAPVASAIKIGEIAIASHITVLASFLKEYKQQHPAVSIIYEPLSISLTDITTDTELVKVIKARLLPLIDVLIVEQYSLASSAAELFSTTKQVMNSLFVLGVKGVCVKAVVFDINKNGLQDIVLDIYVDAQREVLLSSSSAVAIKASHSGIFSTVLATVVAQDYPIDDALVVARAYLNQPSEIWPSNRCYFPQVVLPNTPLGDQLGLAQQMQLAYDFAPCDTNQLGLYPVVDTVQWLEKVLQQGVKTLQLRIKDKTPAEVVEDVKAAVALGRQYQARLFINDYWQLAIEHGAYGVHLGQEDMLIADFVAIKQAGLKLGLSTHGYYEILRAHQIKPSYIALGHIYPTVTKDMPSKPQGLVRLQRYADLMQDYPLVAIGGISIERAPKVAATGVGSVAVVTAITRADDYKKAIAELLSIVEQQPNLVSIGS